MKPLIAIALSGGIDSLSAAHILKESGHDVIGIHFITGYEIQPDDIKKNDEAANQDSEILATIKNQALQKIEHLRDQLKIDVKLLDCSMEFKGAVVDYFMRTYQAGQTPNPCIVCNPAIKFGSVLTYARKL
ncbi:MAG: hypothetical protein KKH68_02215, partial [Proteobacteria bacterium]|nr:hypothetical protein [Pseudomonadota bacterium]